MNEEKQSDKPQILNAFQNKTLGKYFGNPVVVSIFYFILLISFIILLFSSTYITISSLVTVFFVYLLLKQIYYKWTSDNSKEVSYFSIIMLGLLIITIIFCNMILPAGIKFVAVNKTSVVDTIQQPVYSIIYTSLIYSILFILLVVYTTFNKNKITLLLLSGFFVFAFVLYMVIRSHLPASITNAQTSSTLINILLYTPLSFSCLYIIFIFIKYFKYIFGSTIKNSSFANNIIQSIPIQSVVPENSISAMKQQLDSLNTDTSYKNTKIPFQVGAVNICTIIFVVVYISYLIKFINGSAVTNFGQGSEPGTYEVLNALPELGMVLINGSIISVITILIYKMYQIGLPELSDDAAKLRARTMREQQRKITNLTGELALENSEIVSLAFLILYDVALANIFNNDYFNSTNFFYEKYINPFIPHKWIDKYIIPYLPMKYIPRLSTIFIIIIYIITFFIYYKVLTKEKDVKNNSDLLMFFITIILFVSVILIINNSSLAKRSALNNGISPYIYAIIAYSVVFAIGLFILYFVLKSDVKIFNIDKKDLTNTVTYALFTLFVLLFLFTLINWIIQIFNYFTLKNRDGSSSVLGIILNIAIVITMMALLFRMLTYGNFLKESSIMNDSPMLQLVIASIFYIPCLLIAGIEMLTGLYKKGSSVITNAASQTTVRSTDIILIVIIILLYIIYYSLPTIYNFFASQGGKLLLKEPVYTNIPLFIASQNTLQPNPKKSNAGSLELFNYSYSYDWTEASMNIVPITNSHSYNYALSSWIFINGNSAANSQSNEFYSLMNYGGKPNIQYRGKDNQLRITIQQTKNAPTNNNYDFDEEGNLIIYKNTIFLLQKWNNIVVNYESGILDIFINGELQQSFKSIIPYMSNDDLNIGETDGVHGGICNIVYFNEPLNIKQIYYLYHSMKDLSPPIGLNYYDRLYISSLKVENATNFIGLNQISN